MPSSDEVGHTFDIRVSGRTERDRLLTARNATPVDGLANEPLLSGIGAPRMVSSADQEMPTAATCRWLPATEGFARARIDVFFHGGRGRDVPNALCELNRVDPILARPLAVHGGEARSERQVRAGDDVSAEPVRAPASAVELIGSSQPLLMSRAAPVGP